MNTTYSTLGCVAGVIALGAALALPAPLAHAAAASSQADDFPSYESYIKISGRSAWISGDDASFATHTGTPAAGTFGIEDLLFTKDVSDATTITVKGRALDGTDDYLASFDVDTINVGSINLGYKRFRTFYDGVGGFFPETDQLERLTPEQLHVDRSSFWMSATLAKPDRPVLTLSFHDEIRTGMKDSTEWAPILNPDAVVVKRALVGTALPTNTPYINPNVQELDEHHKFLEAGMVAKFGSTTETLKATFDWVSNVDERDYVKFPGSTVIADPMVEVQDDREARMATAIRLLQQTETQFNEHVALDVGLTYSHLSSTNGGDWITPTYSSTAKAIYVADTAAQIYGGSRVDDYTGNIFLKLTPNKNWLADIGLREESNVVGSAGGFTTTTLATGATTVVATKMTTSDDLTYSHYIDHTSTPEVSVQYLGFGGISLYGTFDDCIDRGTQHWINPYAASTITGAGVITSATAPIGSVFFQDANQDYENAKLGANWNASSKLTVRAELYRKDHENRFIGADDIIGTGSYGGLFVTGYIFTGVKLSVIYKPVPQLSFNTRYQPQSGNMSVTANVANGGLGSEITSGKARGQEISESINWTPSGQIYLQGNINVVYNYIQTAYPVVVVSATTDIATPIQNANNNYVVGSVLCGFVFDKRTDVQIRWSWERADNYNPQIAAGGQAYGASFDVQSVTAGLKHKFSERLIGDFRVGYLDSTNPTTGGFTNYHGPLAYAALTYAL